MTKRQFRATVSEETVRGALADVLDPNFDNGWMHTVGVVVTVECEQWYDRRTRKYVKTNDFVVTFTEPDLAKQESSNEDDE